MVWLANWRECYSVTHKELQSQQAWLILFVAEKPRTTKSKINLRSLPSTAFVADTGREDDTREATRVRCVDKGVISLGPTVEVVQAVANVKNKNS